MPPTKSKVPAKKITTKVCVKPTTLTKSKPAIIKKANAKSAKAKVAKAKNTVAAEANDEYLVEEWKMVAGFSKYECSNLGNVRNINNKRPLKGEKNPEGYIRHNMSDDNNKRIHTLEHRIIALTWIKNDDNKPTVDHINRKRNDNRVINLRWATKKQQAKNRESTYIKGNNTRSVWKCDLNTNEKIKFYNTITEAALDIGKAEKASSNISICALGKYKHAYGFKWIYANENNVNLENEEWKLYLSIKSSKYYVSNCGRIKNNNKILKPTKNGGYLSVNINKKPIRVHRLVATLFVDNPDPTKYNVVNHKNSDKINNNASNLEWTNAKGNTYHAIQNNLNKAHKRVIYYDNSNIIKTYANCAEAARDLKVNRCSVRYICEGLQKSCGNTKLKFKYLDDSDDLENMKITKPRNVINKKNDKKNDKKMLYRRRAIEVYNKNGELIDICKNVTQATIKYKVNKKTVVKHCLDTVKYPNTKYTFKYEDYNESNNGNTNNDFNFRVKKFLQRANATNVIKDNKTNPDLFKEWRALIDASTLATYDPDLFAWYKPSQNNKSINI